MKALHEGFYDESAFALPEKLLMGWHPGFPASNAWPAFPPARSLKRARHHSSSLARRKIGRGGGFRAGLYRPPVQPFANAVEALQS